MNIFRLRYFTPLLAVIGLGYAVYYTAVLARPDPPPPTHIALPPVSSFDASVAGSGLIEANSRNIAVGTFESGVVTRVDAREGAWVTKGDPLFVVDNRLAKAELAVAERDERAAAARVEVARTAYADLQDQRERFEKLRMGVSITEDRLFRIRFAAETAAASLETAKAELDAARARAETARVTLERLTVTAPIDGRVLKVNVRPGEFVSANAVGDPPVLLGNDQPLHVRVQIDENDLWRLDTARPAEAAVRGNRQRRFPLRFVRLEPYALPKRSLTGDRTERIDTRVLEVIYAIDDVRWPLFIGQQVDVFIEAEPLIASTPAAATPAGGK